MKVWVIFGSKNTEHDVSIASAYWIMQWLIKNTEHEVYPIYITKEWKWIYDKSFLQINNLKELTEKNYDKYQFNIDFSRQWKFYARQKILSFVSNVTDLELDVMFLILHWKNWEDGTAQWLCQMLDVPYVSTSALGSAIWINKSAMKDVLKSNNIPVVDYISFLQWDEDINQIEKLWYPIFVKPANLGSSIWISKVNNKDELMQAIEVAYFYDNQIICEKWVKNLIELNCSILVDKDQIIVSEIEKVSTKADFLSFEEKYINDGGTMQWVEAKVEIPAKIPSEIQNKIYELSKKSAKALQIDWWAPRIDFLREDWSSNVYVNEINTIPWAMQLHLWLASWFTTTSFLNKLIDTAIYRRDKMKSKSNNFNSSVIDITVNFKK